MTKQVAIVILVDHDVEAVFVVPADQADAEYLSQLRQQRGALLEGRVRIQKIPIEQVSSFEAVSAELADILFDL
jgi:hypothetical protein